MVEVELLTGGSLTPLRFLLPLEVAPDETLVLVQAAKNQFHLPAAFSP